MFAIELTEDNLEKIYSRFPSLESYMAQSQNLFVDNDYVLVSGYVWSTGKVSEWELFPMYVIDRSYEYNPETIKTDWDQIVRKAA